MSPLSILFKCWIIRHEWFLLWFLGFVEVIVSNYRKMDQRNSCIWWHVRGSVTPWLREAGGVPWPRPNPAMRCKCVKSETPAWPSRIPAPGFAETLRALQVLHMLQIKGGRPGPRIAVTMKRGNRMEQSRAHCMAHLSSPTTANPLPSVGTLHFLNEHIPTQKTWHLKYLKTGTGQVSSFVKFYFILHFRWLLAGFPGGASGKEPACQCRRCRRRKFDPWDREIPWRRAWQPTPEF